MRSILIALFALIFSSSASGHFAEGDYFGGSTSDDLDFYQVNVSYVNGKNDLFWPYQQESSNEEWGLDFRYLKSQSSAIKYSAFELASFGSHKWNEKNKLRYELGTNQLKQDGFKEKSFLLLDLKYEFFFSDNLFGSLSLGQSFDVPVIIPLRGRASDVFSQNGFANLSYKVTQKWQLDIKYRLDILEDKNQRNWFDLQAMYSIATFPHWIRVGFGSSQLNYQSNSLFYWSPRNFSSHGPRVDMSLKVIDEVHWFVGGSYSFFREDDFSPGQGYYARTGVNYGSRDKFLVEASFENVESTQNNRLWYSHFAQIRGTLFW